jgi:hypothetical protein
MMTISYGNECFYCGRFLTRSTRTRDHKVPVGRGGNKRRDNIVASCLTCNGDKAHLTVEEYRAVIAYRNKVERLEIIFFGERESMREKLAATLPGLPHPNTLVASEG